MARDAAPVLPFVTADPEIATRRSEIESHRIVTVGCHGLAFDCPPCLSFRQTLIETFPGFSRASRPINAGLAVWTGAGPHAAPVHWKNPHGPVVTRVYHHWKADIAHAGRHVPADTNPFVRRTIDA